MKTLKNSFKNSIVIAGIVVLSAAQSLANDSTEILSKEAIKEAKYMRELLEESDLVKFERDLINEGILSCDGTTKVKILGEDDKVVYEGEISAFDNPNKKLQQWISKADHIITVGNTSFYKVF